MLAVPVHHQHRQQTWLSFSWTSVVCVATHNISGNMYIKDTHTHSSQARTEEPST
jgi:hypothetical protein